VPIVITQVTSEDLARTKRELTQQFPSARFGWPPDVKSSLLEVLLSALEAGDEEAIQKVLTTNPYLIQYAIKRSGHHGIWVFPKAMIRPRGADGISGLIPDYLIETRSSLGYFWHVVELKRSTYSSPIEPEMATARKATKRSCNAMST
jgi:hypothetical protein